MKLGRILTLGLSLSVAACASKAKVEPQAQVDPYASDRAAAALLMENFQRVHFEFDSAKLSYDAADALAANASILRKHDRLSVEVQGHCDERGSTEYNLALGQRRAEAIRKYLRDAGVSEEQLRTISYGEEAPLVMGHDDRSWSRNRRAEFRVMLGNGLIEGTVASWSTTAEPLAKK